MHLIRWSAARVAVLTLAGAVSLTSPVWAARPGHFGPGHFGGPGKSLERLERQIEALNLDEATQQKVYGILDRAHEQRRTFTPQLRAAHEQMRTLMEQEPADADAILAQADKVGALRTEAHKQQLRTLLELRATLTPEQWSQLQQQMHKYRGRRDLPPAAPEPPDAPDAQ